MLALAWAATGTSLAETPRQTASTMVVATAETENFVFNIPSGELATALDVFARQAGVPVAYDRKKIEGLTTAGLKGSYPVQAGLDVLLRGTGYVSERRDAGFGLVPEPPAAAGIAKPMASR
jgi:hypothetical protein